MELFFICLTPFVVVGLGLGFAAWRMWKGNKKLAEENERILEELKRGRKT